jgi:hypothetical protein
VLLLQLTIALFSNLEAGWMLQQFPLLFAVSAVGTLLGLAISAGVPGSREGSNIAVLVMIAVVIPQVLFSGGLAPLSGIAKLIGQTLVTCYWGIQGLSSLIDLTPPPTGDLPNLVGGSYLGPLLVVLLHAGVATGLLVLFMLRKDEATASQWLRRLLPRGSIR